ncbi:LysR family transcriptional regulator [Pollutimonas subterranea]|uniref:LysR family transcriptional regulator n=1 Tax=Pollutimonas subterranea TaxID=2045210 RepID=A0A2N4U6L3_9BURK|nr:LysR family transcriptional regulator [Pollutimonas subterranea]PLC50637.1 LysR family transcriptional regulator [Pollutimonas subterranea]
MELRQLRYFVRVVELGSMGRAAQDLGVVTSALSQQISRLESELSTRLLQRTSTGVVPTAAGLALRQEAELVLRHAASAVHAAKAARLAGHVSIGMAPTTSSVLGVPLLQAMQRRYPDVRLHLVESLSGNLSQMLGRRQLDLAVLFHAGSQQGWTLVPMLTEQLFVVAQPDRYPLPTDGQLSLKDIVTLPLVLPTGSHGLRAIIDAAFFHYGHEPNVVAEVDGLSMLMDIVQAGLAATIQPGAAVVRANDKQLLRIPLLHDKMVRRNLVASLSDDQLSPAGLAARVVLIDVMRELVAEGCWPGAELTA